MIVSSTMLGGLGAAAICLLLKGWQAFHRAERLTEVSRGARGPAFLQGDEMQACELDNAAAYMLKMMGTTLMHLGDREVLTTECRHDLQALGLGMRAISQGTRIPEQALAAVRKYTSEDGNRTHLLLQAVQKAVLAEAKR